MIVYGLLKGKIVSTLTQKFTITSLKPIRVLRNDSFGTKVIFDRFRIIDKILLYWFRILFSLGGCSLDLSLFFERLSRIILLLCAFLLLSIERIGYLLLLFFKETVGWFWFINLYNFLGSDLIFWIDSWVSGGWLIWSLKGIVSKWEVFFHKDLISGESNK